MGGFYVLFCLNPYFMGEGEELYMDRLEREGLEGEGVKELYFV